jgi:hypothetical protein
MHDDPSMDEMRQEILEAFTDVMETSATVFAALLAFLLENRAVDRGQVDETLRAAEQALTASGHETSALAEKFIPYLRARLEAMLAQTEPS